MDRPWALRKEASVQSADCCGNRRQPDRGVRGRPRWMQGPGIQDGGWKLEGVAAKMKPIYFVIFRNGPLLWCPGCKHLPPAPRFAVQTEPHRHLPEETHTRDLGRVTEEDARCVWTGGACRGRSLRKGLAPRAAGGWPWFPPGGRLVLTQLQVKPGSCLPSAEDRAGQS